MRTMTKCYACDMEATSREHVPPKCIFPEKKDIDLDEDHRVDLISVPSCDVHNSKKSGDDEYLMYILVSTLTVNSVAERHAATKILRAMERRPSLSNEIYSGRESVVAETESGERFETYMVPLNGARLDSCFDHVAKGLYFHSFNETWVGKIRSVYNFIMATDFEATDMVNETAKDLTRWAAQFLEHEEYQGKNEMIFRFKIAKTGDERLPCVAQCVFYGGSVVTLLFGL